MLSGDDMGLWAEAVIRVANPKKVNIKDIVLDVLDGYEDDEVIVDSTYSKEDGVCVGIRTDCYMGDEFNTILVSIGKRLRQEGVGFFHIEVLRNWYYI